MSAVFPRCLPPPLGKAGAIHLSAVPRAQTVRVEATTTGLYFEPWEFRNSELLEATDTVGIPAVTTSPSVSQP